MSSAEDHPFKSAPNIVSISQGEAVADVAVDATLRSQPASPRDALDDWIQRSFQRRASSSQRICPSPLDEETLIAHLKRHLTSEERRVVIRHLADCHHCCDRLEGASELLRIESLSSRRVRARSAPRSGAHSGPRSGARSGPPPAPLSPPPPRRFSVRRERRRSALPLEVGKSLMQLDVAADNDCLRIISTNAEVRLEAVTALRRTLSRPGIAFQRRLDIGMLQLALLRTSSGALHVSLTLENAPEGLRGSLIVAGRLSSTTPFRGGQLFLKDVPLRTILVRLESPQRILGHVRLELRPSLPSSD